MLRNMKDSSPQRETDLRCRAAPTWAGLHYQASDDGMPSGVLCAALLPAYAPTSDGTQWENSNDIDPM